MIELNWITIVVAAIINMILGFLWYSPVLFGKKWMVLMGKNPEAPGEMPKDMWKSYLLTFVSVLVMSFILALFVEYKGASTFLEGAILGVMAWLGFVATTSLASVIFENKARELYYINVGYYLTALVVMGGVLGAW